MFSANEYVFYESGGICRISDIQTSPLEGMPRDRRYYVLNSLHDRNGVIYIPVDSETVFLRRLLTRSEAEELLNAIPSVETIAEPNGKQLRNRYLEAMRTHAPLEWVRVIKTVYQRLTADTARPQKLSETERTFAENAKRYLYTELSIALGMEQSEAEACILSRLQNPA